ncbi:MAG: hypothetical protein U1E89_11545 [Burkholderiaceae bacterium]
MRAAHWSVIWQAAGSAATLAAALWVSWRFGLAAQGEFGLAKSWFDVAAVTAVVGLPQALLHLQYRRGVAAAALLRWLARWVAGLAGLALVAAPLLARQGHTLAALVIASLPFAAAHLLARSLLMPTRGVVVFGIVTALPALLLLAGVLAMGAAGQGTHFDRLLLAVAVLAGIVSATMAWRSAGRPTRDDWSRRELWSVSLQSAVQAALAAALAAALLSTVAALGGDKADVGAASLGWHVYQVFAAAAGYAAPLIFDRLARHDSPALPRWPMPVRAAAVALLALAALALVLAQLVPRWSAWLVPLAVMLPAGLAGVAARVAGTVLLARAAYLELSVQAAARLAIAVAVTALALRALPAASALALALLAIELATWWRCAWLARRSAR